MRPPAQAFAWLFIAGTILSACSAHPEPDAEPFPYTVEPRAYSASVKHVSDRVHGVIMALTVTLILPLGGLSWRLLGRVVSSRSLLWFHICCQSLGLGMLVVGFSCGVWSAFTHAEVYASDPYGHTFIGTITVALFLLQPIIGVYHHRQYAEKMKLDAEDSVEEPTLFRSIHRWFGRFLIVFAMINGGLGLKFAGNTEGGLEAYGAIAGIVGVTYIITLVIWYSVRGRPRPEIQSEHDVEVTVATVKHQ